MNEQSAPPEAQLIKRLRRALRPSLSIRSAAKQMGFSESRWRQIEAGYQTVTAGIQTAVIAPPDTLAKMAVVVGATPQQLEDAGRSDAADELRAMPSAVTSSSDARLDVPTPDDTSRAEHLIAHNWPIAMRLAEVVTAANPSDELRDATRAAVFIISEYLVAQVLSSGNPPRLQALLGTLYDERAQLFRRLAARKSASGDESESTASLIENHLGAIDVSVEESNKRYQQG